MELFVIALWIRMWNFSERKYAWHFCHSWCVFLFISVLPLSGALAMPVWCGAVDDNYTVICQWISPIQSNGTRKSFIISRLPQPLLFSLLLLVFYQVSKFSSASRTKIAMQNKDLRQQHINSTSRRNLFWWSLNLAWAASSHLMKNTLFLLLWGVLKKACFTTYG